MGFLRLMYRRKHILFLLLCATTLWLFYYILSFSSEHQVVQSASQSREASAHQGQKKVQETVRKATEAIHNAKNSGVIQPPPRRDEVLQPPPHREDKTKAPITSSPKKQEDKVSSGSKTNLESKKSDAKEEKKDNSKLKQESKNITQTVKAKQEGNFEKVLKIGEKLKNKTLDLGEKMKNKTMEKLSQLGMIKTLNPIKFIYVPDVWKLQLTMDDLSQVMKDTNHLSKQEKIDVNYPKLLPVKSNVTEGNQTVALRKVVMENRVGFCDCRDYECMCCSRVTHKRIQVNMTGCANITFMSKSQELDFRFSMDKKPVYKKQIPVEPAPKICLSSHSKVADICIGFLNMTSKVTVLEDHKFLVVGCLEFSISLFNKTVSAFPVDCFQMPSHQHHQKEDSVKKMAQDFGNWVP
ncbi:uncharacterized protein LOC133193805 [Saccostrea echinata]|uniref:uncharacterized protein LOC133193805 n=1 Tax=Saccostrea echinata TaxID=191078 RepID=UPI002A82E0A7|nr:uncharacterized protein LOC133193805 [Saccostrea echinata]